MSRKNAANELARGPFIGHIDHGPFQRSRPRAGSELQRSKLLLLAIGHHHLRTFFQKSAAHGVPQTARPTRDQHNPA